MAYQSVTLDVREEAENVLVVDFSDADIIKEQQAAYGFLSGRIGEYDSSHTKIDAIRKLEQILAAVFILRYFSQKKESAQSKYELFKELLVDFEASLGGAAVDSEYLHAVTSYGSYVAAHQEDPDTEVRYYKSTRTLMLESQSRLIEQPSVPALLSNDPGYIMTSCRSIF